MQKQGSVFGGLGALASAAGAFFSAFSSADYARHLDRALHGTHCSFLPGIVSSEAGESGCSVAMYSPYSAVLKTSLWGGVPISLFGLGAFSFLLGYSLYFAAAGAGASRRARQGFLLASAFPVLTSVLMLGISLSELGQLCKLCVGVYLASAVLFVSAFLINRAGRKVSRVDVDRTQVDSVPWHQREDPTKPAPTVLDGAPQGGMGALLLPVALLGLATGLPGLIYASALPNYDSFIQGCGKLEKTSAPKGVLVKLNTTDAKQPTVSFEDPLCPACKSLHDRLLAGGIYERLEPQVAIFPLDSECNWMVSRSLHPGACLLSRAFLCAEQEGESRTVLEWSYANQEELSKLGKEDPEGLRKRLLGRFPGVATCIDDKATKKRQDDILRYAVDNKIRISTPQLFVGEQRLCDEDTDMGLLYAVRKLAPELSEAGK